MDAESDWMELFQPAAGKEGDRHSRYVRWLVYVSVVALVRVLVLGITEHEDHQSQNWKDRAPSAPGLAEEDMPPNFSPL